MGGDPGIFLRQASPGENEPTGAAADQMRAERGPPLSQGMLRLRSLKPLRRPRDPRVLPLCLPCLGPGTLEERAKACDLLLKTAAQVLHGGTASRPSPAFLTYLQRTYQGSETQGSHELAVQTSAAHPEQHWSKTSGTNGEKLLTERPVTRRHTATAILGTPAILQNRSPCQETGIQASSSNEGGNPEKAECELSFSPHKSDGASSGSSLITETSSLTSSSSWSHNTLASSPNVSVEESSPEQKEQGSSSPLVTDDIGTPGKAALFTPQAEGEKQGFLSVSSFKTVYSATPGSKQIQRISGNAAAPPCSQQLWGGAARGTIFFTAIHRCSKQHQTL
ncbi:hypothetical protein HPB51_005579 [Rhipicephalus microplus]|uniref:Uncharacterized protein n=1 Tax=Rhipicephalus microplus TaxID=6941 RepID=A0A9J6DYY4_RHIMP|nr:hypothetical protein HPB51_005579 [Rhipicephalus microplus]